MRFHLPRDTNYTTAKAAYLKKVEDLAKTQDLSQDSGPYTIHISIAFTIVAAFFVALRFLTRWKYRSRLWWDDWFILASMIILVGNMGMNIALVHNGLGKHAGALSLEQRQQLDKIVVGAEVMYASNIMLFKLSLLSLYNRLFPVRSVRIGGYILGFIALAWTLAGILCSSFQCTPRKKVWEPWVDGTCINMFFAFLCISVPNILCDIGILCLPIPQVWKLKTNLLQRFFLLGIFLLGSYVVFASVYRFTIYLKYTSQDIPYTLAPGAAWNSIEISSGTISACLPTLGPLMKSFINLLRPNTKSPAAIAPAPTSIVTVGGSNDKNKRKPRDPDASLFTQPGTDEPGRPPHQSASSASVGKRTLVDTRSSDEIPLSPIQKQTGTEIVEEIYEDKAGVKR